ncbi:MAG: methyltransferase family protein [Longimicrobiaceae bacterium]
MTGWIGRRRPLLTAAAVAVVVVNVVWGGARPADLLTPRLAAEFLVPWLLFLVGVGVRAWGAGNLRKNREITDSGVYRMVRHPLYTGSLCVLLGFLLAAGDILLGLALFAGVCLVFYTALRQEEGRLMERFPSQAGGYSGRPRLVPDLRRLPEAIRSDRFSLLMAYRNLGLRSVWLLAGIPLFLEALEWLGRYRGAG